ncbi:MAG: zf-HC2 domain-containing protein [Acidobacteriota bacterium]
MKCDDCLLILDDYLEGELDDQDANQVKLHLSECAQCARLYTDLQREQDIYARYQRDIEVSPALWAGIDAKIQAEKGRIRDSFFIRIRKWVGLIFVTPRFSPALAATLIVTAITVTVVVMKITNSSDNGSHRMATPPTVTLATNTTAVEAAKVIANADTNATAQVDAGETKSSRSSVQSSANLAPPKRVIVRRKPTPEQLVKEAEEKYLAAIAILSRDVKEQRAQLDPDMLARFDDALGAIDRTIAQTRQVVREYPSDPVAVQYLLAAYSKKVDLLKEMTTRTLSR